jgi:hypothetical protein
MRESDIISHFAGYIRIMTFSFRPFKMAFTGFNLDFTLLR